MVSQRLRVYLASLKFFRSVSVAARMSSMHTWKSMPCAARRNVCAASFRAGDMKVCRVHDEQASHRPEQNDAPREIVGTTRVPTSAPFLDMVADGEVMWLVAGDATNTWLGFDEAYQTILEKIWKGEHADDVEWKPKRHYRYRLSVQNMTQTNLDSGTQRPLLRVLITSGGQNQNS